jgi:chemotaxis protein histidine kinase CheA
MALDVKRFISRFVEEARDHLRQILGFVAALETDPADKAAIDGLFRSAHTIKGSSRMLKLTAISDTAHRMEDLLSLLRDGAARFTPDLGRLLLRGADLLAAQVDAVAEGGVPPALDPTLDAALTAALSGEAATPPEPVSPPSPPPSPSPAPAAEPARRRSADTVRVPRPRLDELIGLMGEVVSSHARLTQRLADLRRLERRLGLDDDGLALLRDFGRDLRDDVQSQKLLMEDLHGQALTMRMLPLGLVFEPAARMVRDLARTLGKEIAVVVEGADIELDRQLIDGLADPLLHLLRNAVDHGVETTDQRRAAGKPGSAAIRLSARQDGGWVVIEVGDDGAGLALAAIRDKAVRKGMVTAEQAAALSEADVTDLIFLPGFSTSPIVTDLSGRGVGMDVVKRRVVDDLQGTIAVETRAGAGTVFSLRLPLSLALMRVLLVSAGGQVVGFTGQYVARLLQLPPEALLLVAGRSAVVIDNEFVPVVALAELLGLPDAAPRDDALLLVVVRVQHGKLALRVDRLVDESDMVIKPLPEHLRALPLPAGVVSTGRDELVAILHAPALLELARRNRRPASPVAAVAPEGEAARRSLKVLVVDDSLNTREIERDVLEAHGYQVSLAEDGAAGLKKALDDQFDAILTDVEMPAMDGFSLTAALRREERYRTTPIIIITSRAKDEDRRRGIQVGADAYIVKGDFSQGSLVDTLQTLLG